MWRAAPRPVDSAYVCWGGESKAAYGGLCGHLETGFLAKIPRMHQVHTGIAARRSINNLYL